MTKLKKWELSLLIALCVSLCLGTWAEAKQSALSSELVRLHVIAVSDDEAEQEIKLRVRDAVLSFLTPLLENAGSAEEAREIISENLDAVKSAAERVSGGRKVTVSLREEYYPTRDYESFSLPAGKYRSLRIILGEGKGHNWWCVVFPPLCVSAAEQEAALEAMSDDSRSIIAESGDYTLKFRIVELWEELMEYCNS